jgi:membrane-bound metal-dependent hydrolase YbcI (DUF457 family)
MFLGHFGVAFAAKKVAPQVSLGTTILAAELLDAIWPVLVLAGVETVEVSPGITRVNPLDFVSYPWSHSLAMALVWSALLAAIYWLIRRNAANALWIAALVASHWVLDWIVHRPDLPLYPGDVSRHGLGLWDNVPVTLVLELGLFAAGIYFYVRSTRALDRIGTLAFWAFVATLLFAYAGATFGPPPPSPQVVATSGLAGYLMALWGWWIDRHREARPA